MAAVGRSACFARSFTVSLVALLLACPWRCVCSQELVDEDSECFDMYLVENDVLPGVEMGPVCVFRTNCGMFETGCDFFVSVWIHLCVVFFVCCI